MVKTLPLSIAIAALAVVPVFTAKAEDGDVEMTATEVYSSDMTNWTFSKIGDGAETWQPISGDTYLDDMTDVEKEQTGCDDGIGVVYDDDNDTNAWAISPAVELTGGQLYRVSIFVKAASSGDPENWKLVVGTGDDAEALESESSELLNETGFDIYTFVKRTDEWTPAETAEYHFGLNCYSEAENYGMYATGFKVEKLEEVDTAVSEIEMSSSEAKYYDVNGLQIAEPVQNGLYIKVKDGKAVKVIRK